MKLIILNEALDSRTKTINAITNIIVINISRLRDTKLPYGNEAAKIAEKIYDKFIKEKE